MTVLIVQMRRRMKIFKLGGRRQLFNLICIAQCATQDWFEKKAKLIFGKVNNKANISIIAWNDPKKGIVRFQFSHPFDINYVQIHMASEAQQSSSRCHFESFVEK